MTPAIILFTLILVIVAILTKVIGCGVGAKLCGYQSHQCRRIGVGIVSRGEVALIVASKGTAMRLLGSAFVGPVVITTIITPILLKAVYRSGAVAAVEAGEDITGHYDELANVRREHQS